MIIFEPLNIKINKPIKSIRVFDHNTERILKISKINFSDNTVLVNYGSGIKRWKKLVLVAGLTSWLLLWVWFIIWLRRKA